MCIDSKYVNELEVLLRNIANDIEILRLKQSEYDKKLSDHYHKVETAKFNAAEGYYLSKNLQKILQERRLIKDELYRLKRLHSTLGVTAVESNLTKAKTVVHEAKDRCKKWHTGFDLSFNDIGIEFNH